MKKVKLFFSGVAILLFTVGVFAGRNKYATGAIYGYTGGSYCLLATGATLVNLNTTPCALQATIRSCTGVNWSLYFFNGVTYTPLYDHC